MDVADFAHRPPSVAELARLGFEELRRKFRAGELRMEHVGLAADGGQEYLRAMAAGDVADEELAGLRVGRFCGGCGSATLTATDAEVEGGMLLKVWCGKALEPDMSAARPTCGCLVGLKVNGKVYPGPKVWVGSERCPQRMW